MLVGVYYVLYSLNPNLVLNSGLTRPFHCILPEGTVVNPQFPAAVGMRSLTCGRIRSLLFGAFGQAHARAHAGRARGLELDRQRHDHGRPHRRGRDRGGQPGGRRLRRHAAPATAPTAAAPTPPISRTRRSRSPKPKCRSTSAAMAWRRDTRRRRPLARRARDAHGVPGLRARTRASPPATATAAASRPGASWAARPAAARRCRQSRPARHAGAEQHRHLHRRPGDVVASSRRAAAAAATRSTASPSACCATWSATTSASPMPRPITAWC